MRTVWKFPIPIEDEFELWVPFEHKVILTALQYNEPYVWIEIDTASSPNMPFKFFVEGTGHELVDDAEHVGSWVKEPFVWHLYEKR